MNNRLPLRILLLLLGFLAVPIAGPAQDAPEAGGGGDDGGVPAGHSYHGEAFNEGPRQKAYLMGTTGRVHFPVTVGDPLAQKFFDQGVGQLHGFWYFEAERSFRQVAAIDPECAMAYWGMAMANWENEERARGLIAEAVERKESATRRERLWIESLERYLDDKGEKKKKKRRQRHVRDLEEIIHEFPDDIEAKAFLVVRLWQFKGDLPIVSHEAVSALIEQVLSVEPMHPVHHYRIHLWDYERPDRALASAARCGQSAPGIAHMWHMPGHIFSRLHRYSDACWQQEASARVDHAHMVRDRVLPDQIHNYAHNNEWLIRNLMHVGRVRDAIDLARNMIELPRHPQHNTLEKRGRSASHGRQRLFDVLETFELWEELIALSSTVYLEPTDIEREQVKRLRALGVAYFELGNDRKLAEQLAELERRLESLRDEEEKAVAAAEAEVVAARRKASESAEPAPGGAVTATAPDADAPESAAPDDAAKSGAQAKDADGSGGAETPPVPEGEPGATPEAEQKVDPEVEKARDEARKKFRDGIRRHEEAIAELRFATLVLGGDLEAAREALPDLRGVDRQRLARLHLRVGLEEDAERLAREEHESDEHRVAAAATYVDVLERCGKRDEARKVFERLREMSGEIDIDVPLFRRLAPLATELTGKVDWRVSRETPSDVGERPELDALGPFRWRPLAAPAWTLHDSTGRERSLADYRGRPVVVIFYLGFGCLHCVEQLESFSPRVAEFEEAGLSLIAISTESRESLVKALEKFRADGKDVPFPLVANAELDVFKAYRAFDDFESQPLHGTFLIDGDGLVLWQDISYEPFTKPAWLLEEAKRLLGRVRRVGYY